MKRFEALNCACATHEISHPLSMASCVFRNEVNQIDALFQSVSSDTDKHVKETEEAIQNIQQK